MNCDRAKETMVDSLAGRLAATGSRPDGTQWDFEHHLDECGQCREEFATMTRTWRAMSEWPEQEPGPNVRARFYQMLEAYDEGRRDAQAVKRSAWSFWPKLPAVQFAAAAAMLVVGLGVGLWMSSRNGASQEVAGLKSEVQNMRQLVALSLLQQQSASDRLRGVTYSYRVESSDTEVLSALLRTMKTDSNVNVRLATVDALRQFGDSPVARRGIAQSLGRQDSPLVQVALLGLIGDLHDKGAVPEVRALAARTDTDPTVRERALKLASQLER